MKAMPDPRAEEILRFWFGAGDASSRKRWFVPDPAFDAEIRDKFAADAERAANGALGGWALDPRGALALVVLLDQFPRNVHRGTELAFAADARALAVTRDAIATGLDRRLGLVERAMLYMPLMHSEDRELQRESVDRFGGLAEEAARTGSPEDVVEYLRAAADFAGRHAAIIERFGRFPHRNAVLGRTSTGEEVQFLTEPGSRF
jgi:uncharacterized protein (DUF924 family)